jgi:hypothetical protein
MAAKLPNRVASHDIAIAAMRRCHDKPVENISLGNLRPAQDGLWKEFP